MRMCRCLVVAVVIQVRLLHFVCIRTSARAAASADASPFPRRRFASNKHRVASRAQRHRRPGSYSYISQPVFANGQDVAAASTLQCQRHWFLRASTQSEVARMTSG